ncbi:hypothetical protein KAU33_08975 [Candidatus Dependentiae bacterium]|nr:hypothetical protein [Candidatus Dependentiae bacterium]
MVGYVEMNGTRYDEDTPEELIHVLEQVRNLGLRIKLCYGDQMTGRDWEETCDIKGYVSRSTGKIKVPILVYNTRNISGSEIPTAHIVKIEYANKKQGLILWEHPNYHRV